MKRKRYTEEQIIGMLKEHEAGVTIEDLPPKHGVAKSSLQRWKAKFSGMEVSDAEKLRELAEQYPRYGYLMLHAMRRAEGLVVNRKRTYRIYTDMGMQVRTKRRKKLTRPRVPMVVPTRLNERCSLDFVHDQLGDGRRIRILHIVNDF